MFKEKRLTPFSGISVSHLVFFGLLHLCYGISVGIFITIFKTCDMNLMDDAAFLARVIGLMKRKSTGDADRFAAKLNMSKRSVQRLIQALKDEGYPIEFCKSSDSYILTEPVSYEFRVTVGSQDLMKIKGGRRPSIDLIGFENL